MWNFTCRKIDRRLNSPKKHVTSLIFLLVDSKPFISGGSCCKFCTLYHTRILHIFLDGFNYKCFKRAEKVCRKFQCVLKTVLHFENMVKKCVEYSSIC